ncbi:hypothetical protein [Sulfuritalea sp.]|uniref:hypothetical protein n=1 Tax=Sulfuritalea sp. TaxID=2480090 RepID=UPI00286E2CBC|nr:hypothetical protein [Sulfuritalea sp.]
MSWRSPAREAESPADRVRRGDCWRGVLAASILGLAAAANAACPPDAADGTVVRKGDLLLAYRLAGKTERIPMAQHFALEVQLCDKDGVSAARLHKADATMPEHRHGMNYRPLITPMGGGRFRVEGMMLHMAGRWQLVFEVQAGKEKLRLSHDVQID